MDLLNTEELLTALQLEEIDTNLYRGGNHDIGANHVFGGQVLSQSLDAALLTVPEDRFVHSMHAYFVLPGDLNYPIIYQVEKVRDGGSFSTRRVKAIQHGKDIFIIAVSFQLKQEGMDHQIEMPDVPGPDDLLSDQDLIKKYEKQLPESFKRFFRPRPIEFRPIDPLNFIGLKKQEPLRHLWFKAKGDVPEDSTVHERLLAYASDYNLLTTAIQPHLHEMSNYDIQIASIDHAMWFHRDFRMDEWLLYALDSPSAGNARGFTRGSIFKADGTLIASVVQEGLLRKKKKS